MCLVNYFWKTKSIWEYNDFHTNLNLIYLKRYFEFNNVKKNFEKKNEYTDGCSEKGGFK